MSTPTAFAPAPTVKYGTIIDAGSSGSRIYIYKWETNGDQDKPLAVTKVFPSNKQEEDKAVREDGMCLSIPLFEIPAHPSH